MEDAAEGQCRNRVPYKGDKMETQAQNKVHGKQEQLCIHPVGPANYQPLLGSTDF